MQERKGRLCEGYDTALKYLYISTIRKYRQAKWKYLPYMNISVHVNSEVQMLCPVQLSSRYVQWPQYVTFQCYINYWCLPLAGFRHL